MKVLIGVDDSTESRDAVRTAFDFFGSAAEYTIASVGNRVYADSGAVFAAGYPASAYISGVELTEQFEAAEAAAEETAREAQQQIPAADVEIEGELGHVGQQLCRIADEQRSDVVVIGSHDKSVWQRLLEPSVGRHLIDHAPCPVLVVRSASHGD